jgi:hypothetical protein
MAEVLWMVSDSLECPRTEFGPYLTRAGAELAAIRLGVQYLLRYEYGAGCKSETGNGRVSVFRISPQNPDIYTRCATCGIAARHCQQWQAEVWADIHEFESRKHLVRLFLKTDHNGLSEVPNWRDVDWWASRDVEE